MLDCEQGNPHEYPIDLSRLTLQWETCENCHIFLDNTTPVALLEIESSESGTIICNFETIEKGTGLGTAIINEIKQTIAPIYLYPESERSKNFWEKCGFTAVDEGAGVIAMEYHS